MYSIQQIVLLILRLLFLIAIPCFLMLFAIFLLLRVYIPDTLNAGQKKKETIFTTKVLDKRECMQTNIRSMRFVYFMAFETSQKEVLELRIPKKVYKKIHPGDIVKLTHFGDKFVELKLIEPCGMKSKTKFSTSIDFNDII